jgi:hypothetical protein
LALSNEYREWHLTPDGWVAGTDKHDFGFREGKEVESPANRLLTVKCGVKMSSLFSGPEEYRHELWRAKGQDQLIADLLEKYGDREAGY